MGSLAYGVDGDGKRRPEGTRRPGYRRRLARSTTLSSSGRASSRTFSSARSKRGPRHLIEPGDGLRSCCRRQAHIVPQRGRRVGVAEPLLRLLDAVGLVVLGASSTRSPGSLGPPSEVPSGPKESCTQQSMPKHLGCRKRASGGLGEVVSGRNPCKSLVGASGFEPRTCSSPSLNPVIVSGVSSIRSADRDSQGGTDD